MDQHQQLLARISLETGLSEASLAPSAEGTIRRSVESDKTAGVPGMLLVISPGSRYAWSVRVTVSSTGKRPRIRLGNAAVMLLEDAIERAKEQHKMAQSGEDPKAVVLAKKEQSRLAAQSRKSSRRTVKELLDFYLAKLKAGGRRSATQLAQIYQEPSEKTLNSKRVTRLELKPILALLDKPACSLDPATAQKLIRSYEERGLSMAEHLLAHLHAAWNVILDDAEAQKSFGIESNPFARVRVSEPVDTSADEDEAKASSKVRALDESEIPVLWHKLSEETAVRSGQGAMLPVRTDDRTRLPLQIGLACGQRVEQALNARRDDIDLERKIWTIPLAHRKIRRGLRKSKRPNAQGPHPVPLHPIAVELWRQALDLCTDPSNPYIFPSMDKHGLERRSPRDHHTLSKFVHRFCKRVGIKPFTPRDLRHTWTTQAARWRLDYEIRERIMDHLPPGMGAKVYDHFDYFEPMRELMEAYGEKLAKLLANGAQTNDGHTPA